MVIMYIPIAIYKNNAVLIDSMDTFALYFCSSVKQKMRSNLPDASVEYDGDGMPIVNEDDEEFGSSGFASEEPVEMMDDDDL